MSAKQHVDRVRHKCGTYEPSKEEKLRSIALLKRRKRNPEADSTYESILSADFSNTLVINVTFHIGYTSDEGRGDEDMREAVRVLNAEFNRNSDRFNSGAAIYTPTKYRSIYETYVSRAGSLNVEFRGKTKFATLPDIDDPNDVELERRIKTQLSPPDDPSRNINVWVVPSISDGILGWSTFPWDHGAGDGIILNKRSFGVRLSDPYVSGNGTLVHELGHYFGLFHVFQGSAAGQDWYDPAAVDLDKDGRVDVDESTGDCCPDTPYQSRPLYLESYPDKWPYSTAGFRGGRSYAMFMNQMAYTSDQIRWMFTKDQCAKMRMFIAKMRPLLSSPS